MGGKNLTKANPRKITFGLKNREFQKIEGLNNRDSTALPKLKVNAVTIY